MQMCINHIYTAIYALKEDIDGVGQTLFRLSSYIVNKCYNPRTEMVFMFASQLAPSH